jgi:predicted NodU family carbamoyl transferase
MNILGLQCGYNGSACIVKDGEIISFGKTGNNLERERNKRIN